MQTFSNANWYFVFTTGVWYNHTAYHQTNVSNDSKNENLSAEMAIFIDTKHDIFY